MPRGTRLAAPSPDFSSDSSITSTPRRKDHRKIRKAKFCTDHSLSQSPYDDAEKESEQEQSVYTDDESAYGTNAASPDDQFSLPALEYIPKCKNMRPSSSFNSSAKSFSPFTQSSYLNIAPLPIFRGSPDECPITHLSRFSKVCRANNASSIEMMTRIFPVTLDGEAALWYDLNIEPYNSLSWEEIKSSFLQAYNRMGLADELRSELMRINQDSEESVRSYFLRLQWVLSRWPDHGLPDVLLEGIFIDGLRKEFQDWIIPQKPSSLNEALRMAFEWEKVENIRGGRERECGFCSGGGHEEKGCEIRERMKGLWVKSKKLTREYSGRIGNGEDGEEFKRWVSAGGESTCEGGKINEEEEVGEGEAMAGSDLKKKKKSQCQLCCKHQCSRKRLERNSSTTTTTILTANNSNAG